ncbi:pyruvate kinase [Anaerosphaera multitolerans]|uniref:Pyruvate kinase n=1 Tax=Anaerosphaera multitolerans TaxID=2487351 RepID=A0A437S7M9_9FIRM|nr:pyruvate kinase [Anaerosphaera multitolerans]RVU55090.1 pyruvate kinase [Anaerosphaera multitolerans]
MKRTKIVATIGPTSESEEMLKSLFQEGVDVCRLNFSHGSHEEHQIKINRIKKIREELNLPIAIMMDTKGPEIRLGVFKDMAEIELKNGDKFTLTTRDIEGDENIVSLSYKELPEDVKIGSRVLIDDGLVGLIVEKIEGTEVYCVVENGGKLSSRKGVNIPGIHLKLPALTEKDREDIIFGIENDIDFIAASFIRKKEDVLELRKVLEENGNFNIRIISKIESGQGLENIDDILEVSDGIMVARGDLGVEIETEEVPIAQKEIINKCNIAGKAVITATQMLDSMMRNPRPTRAEANDVANAVLDGTSAVMLSGETASGKYPLLAVRTMRKIVEVTENSVDYKGLLRKKIRELSTTTTNAIGKSTCTIAEDLEARAIITATTSGHTTRAISKFRPKSEIIAATPYERVRRQLSLEWGVVSVLVPDLRNTDDVIDVSIKKSLQENLVSPGDVVIVTAGVPVGLAGSTNLIKVQTIAEILSKGTGIGSESVTAKVVVVRNKADLVAHFKDGDIIVTSQTDKDIMQYVERSAGIVTEMAGYTSHAAITGITLGIPTIVGASSIMGKVKTGDIVTMDPIEGTIRKGI